MPMSCAQRQVKFLLCLRFNTTKLGRFNVAGSSKIGEHDQLNILNFFGHVEKSPSILQLSKSNACNPIIFANCFATIEVPRFDNDEKLRILPLPYNNQYGSK
jgi:hypothetical protein